MNKLLRSLLLAATGLFVFASAQAADTIVIGLDDNFPPMGFRDKDNQLVGYDIDLAREAAKRMDAKVEFKPIEWSAKEAELNGKRIDALFEDFGQGLATTMSCLGVDADEDGGGAHMAFL